MAAPIKDRGGQVLAVLVGITALDAPGFLAFNPQDHVGEKGGFLLISPRDRQFLTSTNPDMVLKPTPADGVNLRHDRAMQAGGQRFFIASAASSGKESPQAVGS